MNPLDLERLALRIETLQRVSTHGWMSGDDLDFKRHLPTATTWNHLPDPVRLRAIAQALRIGGAETQSHPHVLEVMEVKARWRDWISTALRMESLVRRNDPRNPRRVLHDMARGKLPRF